MDVANYLYWKELVCVITFVLQTQEKGIILKPDKKSAYLKLKIYLDAIFVGDQDSRWSIMGRLIYLNNTLIDWNSKAMSSVPLSATEAKYVSMSEGLKDV